jgi:diadenosine tetraphosphate (Ap4A) HIT family hydrolase
MGGGHVTGPAGRYERPAARERLAAARAGEDPTVIAKLRGGFVALGTTQFLPGYCVLIADREPAGQLSDLPRPERAQFLTDLGLVGEALAAACAARDPAFSRVDYEITGHPRQPLQAHVFPRYTWEPPGIRDGSVWLHPPARWHDPAHALGPAHERLIETITWELSRVLAESY